MEITREASLLWIERRWRQTWHLGFARLLAASPTDWKLLFIKRNSLAEVDWSRDPSVVDQSQTPRVHIISADDPRYTTLLRTAEISYSSAVLVPRLDSLADVLITVHNAEREAVVVTLKIGANGKRVFIAAGQTEHVMFTVPFTPVDNEGVIDVPISASWNGKAIPGLQAVRCAPIRPVDVTIAPTLGSLNITANNMSPSKFTGYVELKASDHTTKVHVSADSQATKIASVSVNPFDPYSLRVITELGQLVQQMPEVSFTPYPDFPKTQINTPNFELIAFPNNSPALPVPMQATTLASGGPAKVGIIVRYQTSQKWIYTTVHPTDGSQIPSRAKALIVWVYAHNNNVPLRARFNDATGQTFQPDLGSLNWTGWRAVRIPIMGDMSHWGGANDGVQHVPLKWDSLLLIDGTNHAEGAGQITMAYPCYELKR